MAASGWWRRNKKVWHWNPQDALRSVEFRREKQAEKRNICQNIKANWRKVKLLMYMLVFQILKNTVNE